MNKCQVCIFNKSVEKTIVFDKNKAIFNEGEKVNNVYKIQSGIVKLSKLYLNGEEKLIDILHTGDYLALLTILKGNDEYLVTASTVTEVTLQQLNIDKAKNSYDQDSHFKEMCLSCAANRLGVFQNQLFNFTNLDIEDKILNILKHLQQKFGYSKDNRYFLILPITKTDIASMIGLRRETLSRKLAKMQNDKILKIDKNLYEFLSM